MHIPWVPSFPPSNIFSSLHVWKVLNDPSEDAPANSSSTERSAQRRKRPVVIGQLRKISSKPQRFNSTFEPSPSVSGDGDDDNLCHS